VLDTDTSDTALGAELQQEQNGKLHVVGYASRTLSPAEARYCITRRELLGVVFGLKKYRQHLLGRPISVQTDHALTYLMKSSHGASTAGSGIPVGYPQASVGSIIPAGLGLGTPIHPGFGFPVSAQDIGGRHAIPAIVRTRAGLLRLVATSLAHLTIFAQFANTTTNQQNTSFFNGNAQCVTYSL